MAKFHNLTIVNKRIMNNGEVLAYQTIITVLTETLSGQHGEFKRLFTCFYRPETGKWKYGKNKLNTKKVALATMENDVQQFIKTYGIRNKK